MLTPQKIYWACYILVRETKWKWEIWILNIIVHDMFKKDTFKLELLQSMVTRMVNEKEDF